MEEVPIFFFSPTLKMKSGKPTAFSHFPPLFLILAQRAFNITRIHKELLLRSLSLSFSLSLSLSPSASSSVEPARGAILAS